MVSFILLTGYSLQNPIPKDSEIALVEKQLLD